MDTAASIRVQAGARQPLPAAAAPPAAAPHAAAPAAEPAGPPAPADPEPLKVEQRRDPASGTQVTRLVDPRTGELLGQIPAQQVLNVVNQLLELIHAQEHGR